MDDQQQQPSDIIKDSDKNNTKTSKIKSENIKETLNLLIYEYLKNTNIINTAQMFYEKFSINNKMIGVEGISINKEGKCNSKKRTNPLLLDWYTNFIEIAEARKGNQHYPFITDRIEFIQKFLEIEKKRKLKITKNFNLINTLKINIDEKNDSIKEVNVINQFAVILTNQSKILIFDLIYGVETKLINLENVDEFGVFIPITSLVVSEINEKSFIIGVTLNNNLLSLYLLENSNIFILCNKVLLKFESDDGKVKKFIISAGRVLLLTSENLVHLFDLKGILVKERLFGNVEVSNIVNLCDDILVNEVGCSSILQISSSNFNGKFTHSYSESPTLITKENRLFYKEKHLLSIYLNGLDSPKFLNKPIIDEEDTIDYEIFNNKIFYLTSKGVYVGEKLIEILDGIFMFTTNLMDKQGVVVFTKDGKLHLISTSE